MKQMRQKPEEPQNCEAIATREKTQMNELNMASTAMNKILLIHIHHTRAPKNGNAVFPKFPCSYLIHM